MSAATLTVASGVGTAQPGFREAIEQAQLVRDRTGSHELYLKYLHNQGFEVANRSQQYAVPVRPADEDDVSAQELDDGNLSVELTLVYNYFHCSLQNIYSEYSWDWNNTDSFGEPPKDYVSMGWPTDHYTYESETHGDRVNHFDRDNNGGASVWEYEDEPLGTGWGDEESHSSYAGCYVTKSSTNEDRHIGAKYRHTWENIELTGWSYTMGPDGETTWAPEFSSVEYVWNDGFEKIYESEAEYDNTNC